jgi:DNA polymerase-3 subunit epsilon
MTRRQLREAGLDLAEDQRPQGVVVGQDYYYLYDRREAVPRRRATPAQLAALDKARAAALKARTCRECGYVARRKRDLKGGLCRACAFEAMAAADRAAAVAWARDVLADPGAIILDTETSGLDGGAEIVEIAVIDVAGNPLLDTLVRPGRLIPPEATAIHGIADADVVGAPAWSEIHERVGELLRAASQIVIYNADFDRAMLRQTQKRYGLPGFEVEDDKYTCAMEWYAAYCGQWSDYHGSYRWQPLWGGDHRALGDCLATLNRMRAMAQHLG